MIIDEVTTTTERYYTISSFALGRAPATTDAKGNRWEPHEDTDRSDCWPTASQAFQVLERMAEAGKVDPKLDPHVCLHTRTVTHRIEAVPVPARRVGRAT